MVNLKIEQAHAEIIENCRILRKDAIGNKFSRIAKVVKPSDNGKIKATVLEKP